VKEDVGLSAWRKAWNPNEKLGEQIFSLQLLNDPKIYFVAGYEGGQIKSGCLVNKTSDVLGISNFFSPSEDSRYWSDMVLFIHNQMEDADIVGYEHYNLAGMLRNLGFQPAGKLVVWSKSHLTR
jgi:hypothetical protein